MKNRIIILGPGKSGTTFLGSRIINSVVFHEIGSSSFKMISSVRKFMFFCKIIFFRHVIILPFRNDFDRQKSVFWNDFEKALIHFKNNGGSTFKSVRYDSAKEYLQTCFRYYPYESYAEWFKRNNLHWLIEYKGKNFEKSKFFRSDIIFCPVNCFENLLSDLESNGFSINENSLVNSKDEFWHRLLHKYVE